MPSPIILSTPVRSPASSPRRRVLHERTPSQTNERTSPPHLRPRMEKEEIDYYAASPYPTKPAQVLLPRPGKGQSFRDLNFGYDIESHRSSSRTTYSTSTIATNTTADTITTITAATPPCEDGGHPVQLSGTAWEFPTADPDREPSLSQVEDISHPPSRPFSSSFPASFSKDDRDLSGEDGETDSAPQSAGDDDEIIALPPIRSTVNVVLPDTSSNFTTPEDRSVHGSSPNVVPIGLPSSPNVVTWDSSSPNLIPIGSPSSIVVPTRQSSSATGTSFNSLGTVIRTYHTVVQRSFSGSTSHSNSRAQSFRSSPPESMPGLPSNPSISSFALPSTASNQSRPPSASTPSVASAPDLQSILDSGTPVQYPTIRAPSSSGSWAESYVSPDPAGLQAISERPSGYWSPHLSAVSSRGSVEHQWSPVSPSLSEAAADGNPPAPSQPAPEREGNKTVSTVRLVEDPSSDEHLDSVSNLPPSALGRIPSVFSGSSSDSRANSLVRPGSSSSLLFNTLPNWVRLYYRGDGRLLQNPALSLFDASRPSSSRHSSRPTSPNQALGRVPTMISRPRTRPRGNSLHQLRQIANNPADPRSHWQPSPPPRPVVPRKSLPAEEPRQSPHLHRDRQDPSPRNTWLAPSMDSTAEPWFGRRNVQIYAFCLGFIFPLIWLAAAFLPLPPKDLVSDPEAASGEPNITVPTQPRTLTLAQRRYENAQWWRNLNRLMVPVGSTIIVVIITLAALGTRESL